MKGSTQRSAGDDLTYREKLSRSTAQARSIFCLGIDPMVELFPEELRPTGTLSDIAGITRLVHTALQALEERGLQPGAFKPNIGYFAACDRPMDTHLPLEERFAGSLALAEVIHTLRQRMPGVPLILDSKRGDIARSSTNYAREAFLGWHADAVTVSPWMGDDSVEPFLEEGGSGRGIYLLVRTSNPGAARFQNLPVAAPPGGEGAQGGEGARGAAGAPGAVGVPGAPLYQHVLAVAREWAAAAPGTRAAGTAASAAGVTTSGTAAPVGARAQIGAVVGATAPVELAEIAGMLREDPIPLLLPGVGRQGGTAREVLSVLRETAYPVELVRVNISSGALFPWAGSTGTDGGPPDLSSRQWPAAVSEAVVAAHASLAITGADS